MEEIKTTKNNFQIPKDAGKRERESWAGKVDPRQGSSHQLSTLPHQMKRSGLR